MFEYLYQFLFRKPPKVSKLDAISIAERFAAEQGWRVFKPHASDNGDEWGVALATDRMPFIWISVCKDSGEIRETEMPSR